jgi:hypothetical protein
MRKYKKNNTMNRDVFLLRFVNLLIALYTVSLLIVISIHSYSVNLINGSIYRNKAFKTTINQSINQSIYQITKRKKFLNDPI